MSDGAERAKKGFRMRVGLATGVVAGVLTIIVVFFAFCNHERKGSNEEYRGEQQGRTSQSPDGASEPRLRYEQLHSEQELRRLGDEPTLAMLDLWSRLCVEQFHQHIEVKYVDRHYSPKWAGEGLQLNLSEVKIVGGKLVLLLFLDCVQPVDLLMVTHELGHRVLDLQGYRGTTHKHLHDISILLNSLAQHPPLYKLQKSVGHDPQQEINSRAESDTKRLKKQLERPGDVTCISNALLVADDLMNCSEEHRTTLRDVLSRYHPNTWRLVQEFMDIAKQYDLHDPADNTKFVIRVTEMFPPDAHWHITVFARGIRDGLQQAQSMR